MLFGADTKELFLLNVLEGAGIKKTLSQYVRRCWHKKAVSNENARRGYYKRSSSNSNRKELFPHKVLGGASIEKARLTQYVRRG